MALIHAQDTRTVVEPTFPVTCTALAAQQAIVSGEPASETTFDTSRIQTALTACPSGQAVELTLGGTNNVDNAFLAAPLNIPSGVTLIVDGGVTLFGSRNPADYQSTAGGAETCGTVGTAGNGCNPLIQINNGGASSGSGVMGYGVINGRGGDKLLINGTASTNSWWDIANQANGNGAQNNPILLYAKNASNFTLYKISLLNSPMFHVKYQDASGFTVWGVKIVTPYSSRNTDGIDPDDRISNITINNSYISDGDDNVAIGASGTGNGVSNVTIENTHTYSGHGVSIGSITSGGVSNVLVQNVNMAGNLSDGNSGGLKIKSADDRGGVVNNVQYQNVCIQNIRAPLQFNPFYNANAGTSYPWYQNIGLHSVTVASIAGSGIQVEGYDANHPTTITFDNLNVTGPFTLTPTPQYSDITIGPGPVTPASLQTIHQPSVVYGGTITNPSEAAYACPTTSFPFLAGELYLSTSTLNNQKTLSLPNPASLTLNAVVEITEASNSTPTSSIQFYEGTNLVGTAALGSNGTLASVTLTGVSSGVHTYTALYPKDSAYAALPFGSVTVNVNTTGTTTSMTTSTPATTYGSPVALTATVVQSAGTTVPTGTVSFQNNGAVIGTATLNAQGVAVLNTNTLATGNDSIVAFFQGSTNFGASDSSASPVNVSIAQSATTTTVGVAPASTTYGNGVILTADVFPATSGIPTGTVTFMDGATILGTTTLTVSLLPNEAVGQLTVYTLGTGVHSISAVYGGDNNYTASTDIANATSTVFTASTSVSIGYTSGTIVYGTPVTISSTVNSGQATAATGTITFRDTSAVPIATLATVTIAPGASGATFTTSSLTAGTHNIQAVYSGDVNYTGSNSLATPLVVTQAASTTTVSATSSAITYGGSDTISAAVSPATSGVPSGTVTFLDGTNIIGTQTLFGSVASITTSTLTGGTHSITIVYGGDPNFTGSTSTALVITVSAAPSVTTVSVPAPITYGSAALLSATVASTAPGTLTGTITFKDGSTVLGAGTVSGGAASFSAAALTGGSHSITAVYSGDANYATSTSAPATLTVNKASSTAAVSVTSPTITYGASETFNASVTPTTATGSFTFQDGGLTIGTGTISNGSASFSTTALTAGSHTITAIYSGDNNYLTSTTTSVTVTVNQATSTTSLSANPATITYLTSTALTATVPTGATGTVTFNDGVNAIGTATISNGIATFTAASLAGGSHSISAVYGGDKNFVGSTSTVVTVTVNPAASTTTVSANPATITNGNSTVLTATLANTTGTGTMTFKDGANVLGTTAISGGSASFTAASLSGGLHTITAVYSGDSNFVASTSVAITVTVNPAATTTTLTATPPTITFGGSTTLKATISNTGATGSVTFKDGSTVIGTGTVSAGTASFVAASLSGGSHNITAVYSGDSNFATSTSAVTVVTVNVEATTTSEVAAPATTTFGTSVALTASILPTGGTPSETGTVTFKDGSNTIGTGTVTNGVASISLTTLSTGTHSITASYGGDSNYASSASTSITVTINQVTPTVTLAANPSSITFGSSTTLTATLVPAAATGTVTFVDSIGGTLGTGTVTNGAASISTSTLVAGSHNITAVYSGDTNDTTATSAATTVSVGLFPTTTIVSALPGTLNFGSLTTLTASVSPASVTGTVTFMDGARILGTTNVSAGAATFSVSYLTVGTHSITATYSGDSNNATSTSVAVTVTVSLAPTTTTIAAPATGSYGTPTLITVTVAPSAATGTVTFKDGSTIIGTSALSGGVATLSPILSAGNHTLSASYSGDASYSASATTASAGVIIAIANTSVLVTGNPAAVPLGSATTLTAMVTPAAATGTITFRDSSTGFSLGQATVAAGVASLTGVVLSPAGGHSITATYSGDVNDGASTSPAVTVTVASGPTQIALSNTPASPVMFGTNVTLSTVNTTVLGIAPTGTVQYLDGATLLGSAPIMINVSNVPVSSFSLTTLMPGTHTLTAVYSGDGNYASTTSAAITLVVNQANSTTTLTANPPQVTPNQTYNLTATVASTSGTGTPTGTITFYNSSNVAIGTVPLVGGVATLQQSQTALGSYTYTASYSGDTDFTTSSSAATPTTVIVKQLSDTISVSATPTSGTFGGGTYTVTAIVTPASGGPATGSVTFTDGVNVLGTVTLPSSDTVSLTNLTLLGGVHTITATYSGDPLYVLSVSATPAVITVNPASTTTTVSASPPTSSFGTSVIFQAGVTSTTNTTPTGTVAFMNGGTLLGTATLNGVSPATFTTATLPIAVYSVTAVYSGDTNFAPSTSTPTTVTVNKLPQTITLSTIPPSLTYGVSAITITDSASSTLAVSLAVTGPATLSGTILTITGAGSVTVTATQAGNATYATATPVVATITVAPAPLTVIAANISRAYGAVNPTLTGTVTGVVGNDGITATYATTATTTSAIGTYPITPTLVDPNNRLSNYSVTTTPGTLTVVASVTLALNPTSLSLAAGASGTSTLSVSPSPGFTGSVTLVCSSPVTYITCTVTSPVAITGTTAGTATVTINVAPTFGDLRMPQVGPERGMNAVALASLLPFGALILLPLVGRRRKLLSHKGFRVLALLLMAAGMSLAVTGCAGNSAPNLPPAGSQAVTITATANSAAVTTTLTVNVTN